MSYVEDILMGRCPEDLQEINGVQFTTRQIDILSCFLNGKDPKAIANLLSISQKTVESHGENMRQRAGRFSRQHLICFVEESGKTLLLKKYYLTLCGKIHFEKTLQKISTIEKEAKKILILNSEHLSSPSPNNFLELFVAHLRKSGLEVIVQKNLNLRKLKKENTLLILFSKNFYDFKKDKSLGCTLDYLVEKDAQTPGAVISIVLDEEGKSFIPGVLKKETQISFEDYEHYFGSFLDLLKYLFPQSKGFREIKGKFHRDYSCLWEPAQQIKDQSGERNKVPNHLLHFKNLSESNKHSSSKFIFMMASFVILLLCFLGGGGIFSNQNKNLENSNTEKNLLKTLQQQSIRSDLPLPHESVLLKRPDILKAMDKKLKVQKGVQAIALVGVVGMGGVGKTTLARQYGRSMKEPIVWEINAETKETLVNSFEDLAHATVQTEQEKKDLKIIREIKNSVEREKRLFFLVKKKLKSKPSWLLIYDNVENLSDINKYFPSDPNVWGGGKVVITTRNESIKNNAFINSESVIDVQELTPQEQYYLFKNILYGKVAKLSPIQKGEIKEFLKKLPPFPLDISTAAYYIKDTKILFEEYLKRTTALSEGFEKAKSSLLNAMTDYTKTRYGITTLSLEKIIKEAPDFKELLLFISLLDSQNIPIELLSKYKKEAVVEKFIYQLKKNSFIINEKLIQRTPSFSIHRSIQAIIFAYLFQSSTLSFQKKKLKELEYLLENYIDKIFLSRDIFKMRSLVKHINRFKEQSLILSKTQKIIILQLGWLYYHLGNYKDSIFLLETILKNFDGFKPTRKYVKYLMYLGVVYLDQGKYRKAEQAINKSIKFYKKYYKENKISLAWALTGLAALYNILGKYDKALLLAKKTLRIREKIYGKKHEVTSWSMGQLGSIYNQMGNHKRAKVLLENELIIQQKIYGVDHIIIAWPLLHLAKTYASLGKYEISERLLQKSLHINKTHFGKLHSRVSEVLQAIGKVYLSNNKLEKSTEYLLKSLKIYQKNSHPDIYLCLETLGDLSLKKLERSKINCEKNKFKSQAKVYYRQSLGVLKKHFPKGCLHTKRLENKLARI